MSSEDPTPEERRDELVRSRDALRRAMNAAPDNATPRADLKPQAWWASHPARASGAMALDAATALAKPLAQQHPVALVTGAFAAGALLVYSRPWTWLGKPAVLAGLLGPLIAPLVRPAAQSAAAHLSLAPWMAALNTLIQSLDNKGRAHD